SAEILILAERVGDPRKTRTSGLRFRKPPLYPAELWGRARQREPASFSPQTPAFGRKRRRIAKRSPRSFPVERQALTKGAFFGALGKNFHRNPLSPGNETRLARQRRHS